MQYKKFSSFKLIFKVIKKMTNKRTSIKEDDANMVKKTVNKRKINFNLVSFLSSFQNDIEVKGYNFINTIFVFINLYTLLYSYTAIRKNTKINGGAA